MSDETGPPDDSDRQLSLVPESSDAADDEEQLAPEDESLETSDVSDEDEPTADGVDPENEPIHIFGDADEPGEDDDEDAENLVQLEESPIHLEYTGDAGNVISLMPRMFPAPAPWDSDDSTPETIERVAVGTDTDDDEDDELRSPEPDMLEGTIEALLLTAEKPLTENQLNHHMASPGIALVRETLYRIQDRFRRPGSGIRLVEVAKGWQLRTDIRCAPYVAAMRGEKPVKLSKAALETLSIVAYRQPVTRAEVEDLRGVDPGGILRMLVERGLVSVTGRKDVPGRPLLYGTTSDFLGLFGLRDLSDLPTLRDLRELQRDDPREGIGSTDLEMESALVDAIIADEPEDLPVPTLLHPIQESLPLDPVDPVD